VANLALRRTGDAQRQGHVVAGAQLVDQPGVLKNHPDPAPQRGPGGAIERGGIASEQCQPAVRRSLGEGHDLQQRSLAGAARAGQEIERARFQIERNVGQDLDAGVGALPDMFELDHRDLRSRYESRVRGRDLGIDDAGPSRFGASGRPCPGGARPDAGEFSGTPGRTGEDTNPRRDAMQ
jgi:hypothetical protein